MANESHEIWCALLATLVILPSTGPNTRCGSQPER
jgi:hypothetical protein